MVLSMLVLVEDMKKTNYLCSSVIAPPTPLVYMDKKTKKMHFMDFKADATVYCRYDTFHGPGSLLIIFIKDKL